MAVYTVGLERLIDKGALTDAEWERFKRDIMLEQHKDVMSSAPLADEDPQVKWDFKKDWRTAPLPPGITFGSDYDYWNDVANEARELWLTYASDIPQRDFIAESIVERGGKMKRGSMYNWSRKFYMDGFAIWQNGKEVSFNTRLEGPRVDVGPTADFAAFLENWQYGRKFGAGPVALLHHVGVLYTIAHQLAASWQGVHAIYMMPIRAGSSKTVRETPHRKNPVYTFPVIRIAPRHYRKSTR